MSKRLRKSLGISLVVIITLEIGAMSINHTNAEGHIIHHKIHKSK